MSQTFTIAHINQQGQDIIIIPLNWQTVQTLPEAEQEGVRLGLEYCAHAAGLKGTACLVWHLGTTFYFIAPQQWHPFFRSLDMATVGTMLNKTLTCGSSDSVEDDERDRVRFSRYDEELTKSEKREEGDKSDPA